MLPVLRDGFDQRILTELDLAAAGVTNVIWATGYTFDFSMIALPVTDDDGFPVQTRGVSAIPGLFFVGLPWRHTAKSGLIFGVSEDAPYIADRIAARCDQSEDRRAPTLAPQAHTAARAKKSRPEVRTDGAERPCDVTQLTARRAATCDALCWVSTRQTRQAATRG